MSARRSRGGLGETAPEIEELLGVGASRRKKARAAPRSVDAPARVAKLSAARFLFVCCAFAGVMAACLLRFADMAAQGGGAKEPAVARGFVDAEAAAELEKDENVKPIRQSRAPIIDRNGASLARDVATYELYFDNQVFSFPEELREAAETLAAAFQKRFEADSLHQRLLKRRTTLLARPLTAAEAQKAHDLGVPGLYLTPRYDRYYPAGAVAAHAVGFADIDGKGRAGVEAALNDRMVRDAATPLRLSLDLRVQRAARLALARKAREMSAESASAVVMSAETGEVLALVSLPDYNPHDLPPLPKTRAEQEASALYHRAVAGRYELGSVMKILAYATALEEGAATMGQIYEPLQPLTYGDHEIEWDGGPAGVSLETAFAQSLNRVAAELALKAGRAAQAQMFDQLGLTRESPLELGETALGAPEKKEVWREVDTAVASYGYGIEASPVHLAAAVASLVNGGAQVTPTLLRRDTAPSAGPQVVSAETSRNLRDLMRLAVTDGTGALADISGLGVGGKTGTARRHGPGGYVKGSIRASFVAIAPYDKPKVVVVVTLDEPTAIKNGAPKRSAKYTAAPTAGAIIEAVAPLLGVMPRAEFATPPEANPSLRPSPARARFSLSRNGPQGLGDVTMGGIY